MTLVEPGLAFLSGLLSTLSPCVLPLIPIVMASAVAAHRWGSVALGVGLTCSFTILGLFIATIGIGLGLDQRIFRMMAGAMLVAFGLAALLPSLSNRFQMWASQFGGGGWSSRIKGDGWQGQLAVGLVLGIVWTPCVGPTLGAAATLASSGQDLGYAALLMMLFGIGAAVPLIVIGSLSRATAGRLRTSLSNAAALGKKVLGALLTMVGILTLMGFDHRLEALLVSATPSWLTALTTRY